MNPAKPPEGLINVFLVEDHAFTRDGLRAALMRDPRLRVVGEAASGEEALERLPKSAAHVVVMDIGLPGMSGIEATRAVRETLPGVHVVMLTAHPLETEILASLASGADAYCLKSTDPRALPIAVYAAAIGSVYLDPQIAHVVLGRVSAFGAEDGTEFLPRELEVLKLVAQGLSNREIAERLGVSVATVKVSVQELLAKLSAADRTQAAVKALRRGLI